MPVMNFDLEDGLPPVSFSLKTVDCERFMKFMAECQAIKDSQKPAQHEPVAWLDPWTRNNVTTDYDAYRKHGIPLYTSPPAQRKPLTEYEIDCIRFGITAAHHTEHAIKLTRAIEAAHGIKGDT